MLYNPPSGSSDANAPYVGKNTAGGTQGSKVPPAAVEFPQRELVALIAASGQSPTNTVLVQVAQALGRGLWVGDLTGTGDLAVATLGVVFPSLLRGMRIRAAATAANTTGAPKLRVVNLGTAGGIVDFPILKEDGAAPTAGEIKSGRRYWYEADGAGNMTISGGGIGTTLSPAALSAAKVPFNEVIISLTQRVSMSLPTNSAGQFVSAASSSAYTKQSGSSRLVVDGAYTCFSPIVVGQGAAAVTQRLRATVGGTVLYDEATVTTGYYIGNTNSPCHFGGRPLFLIDNLPAGNVLLELLFKRDDNLAWSTILNPTTSDVPGYPTPNNGKLKCYEEFI
ncbi:hypothetical protein [Methylobacterium radiotolerans]|uniref:hypothetical protein n=1 Tax=Methylobacterium radiotolerans TaxID=31998 RepID=UPI0015F3FCBD|nr:hypothetical protein [Methylobacterium radiotolerans]